MGDTPRRFHLVYRIGDYDQWVLMFAGLDEQKANEIKDRYEKAGHHQGYGTLSYEEGRIKETLRRFNITDPFLIALGER